MKIYPGKRKAVSFTKARVKEQTRYYFGDQLILEARSFKYLGIIIHSNLNWADHVNQLHPTKSTEGSSFHNAYTQKGK
jgi:hypothetical protein